MGEPMRALTVQPPWSDAIAHGTKRVENRTWGIPERFLGQVTAIHAGRQADHGARPPQGESFRLPLPAIPRGAVVAVAALTRSCVPWECRGECSPWAVPGQDHWHLADVRALPEPVPCRGMLGLWRLPPDVEKLVREQLEHP